MFLTIISDANLHGTITQQFDTREDADTFAEEVQASAGTWMDFENGAVLLNEPEVIVMTTGEAEALGFSID